MKKLSLKIWFCLLALSVNLVATGAEIVTVIPAGPKSGAVVREMTDIAYGYYQKNGLPKENQNVSEWVLKAYCSKHSGVKLTPAVSLQTIEDCEKSSEKRLESAALQKFPKYTREEYARMAEERYPMYKIGDKIRVIYMKNPRYPSSIEGNFGGVQGGTVRVGRNKIRLADMQGIEGNELEIQKLDKKTNDQLRSDYIVKIDSENFDGREKFIEENRESFARLELQHFSEQNEEAGYVFVDGGWEPLRQAAQIVTEKALQMYLKQLARDQKYAQELALYNIEQQPASLEYRRAISSSADSLEPKELLASFEKASQEKQGEQAAEKDAEDEETKASQTAKDEDEEDDDETTPTKKSSSQRTVVEETSLDLEKDDLNIAAIIMIIGGVFIAAIVVIMIVLSLKKKQDKERFTKFFEGKGQAQKNFWDLANADPENFKYVSYLFPGLQEATNALRQLSYITTSSNGDLRCLRDILFGVYPHNDGAVAYVGGLNFRYAPWREASAVLPEQPGAIYFKVSTEPEVLLEIPDVSALEDLNIENLGIEEIANPEGGFIRCYKYQTESKENALKFLEGFQVNEEGIVIHVATSEGIFGKDENGIFDVSNG